MALELQICFQETCDGLIFKDITGNYNASTQPGGYGPENDVEGPQDFDTYILTLWGPNVDPSTTTPVLVKNLLISIPAPDEDGYYSWTIPVSELQGMTVVTSGVWYGEAVATVDDTIYEADNSPIFLRDVKTTIVDPAMKDADPDCGCKDGCSDLEIFAKYQAVACNGVCSAESAQNLIDWLYDQCVDC